MTATRAFNILGEIRVEISRTNVPMHRRISTVGQVGQIQLPFSDPRTLVDYPTFAPSQDHNVTSSPQACPIPKSRKLSPEVRSRWRLLRSKRLCFDLLSRGLACVPLKRYRRSREIGDTKLGSSLRDHQEHQQRRLRRCFDTNSPAASCATANWSYSIVKSSRYPIFYCVTSAAYVFTCLR